MSKLVILRGPSGSGKSTIARFLALDYADRQGGQCMQMLEADMFFEGQNGYAFDASKLGQAHNWCQLSAERAMVHNDDLIVSNTGITNWEMKPYLKLAEQYGYHVEVWRTPGPWDAQVLFSRNIHGVPLATLEKQIRKYQPHPGEKEWTHMSIFSL